MARTTPEIRDLLDRAARCIAALLSALEGDIRLRELTGASRELLRELRARAEVK